MPEPVTFSVKEKGGWFCPQCGGLGTLMDGSCSIGPTEFNFTPATRCPTCEGYGHVRVSPVPKEER